MKKLLLLFILVNFIAAPSFAVKLITNDYSDRVVPSRSSRYDDTMPVDETLYRYTTQNGNTYTKTTKNKYLYNTEIGWLVDKARPDVIGGRWLYPDYSKETENSLTSSKPKVEVEGFLPDGIEEINIERKKYNSREAADYFTVDIKNLKNGKQEAITTPSGMVIDEVH